MKYFFAMATGSLTKLFVSVVNKRIKSETKYLFKQTCPWHIIQKNNNKVIFRIFHLIEQFYSATNKVQVDFET